jgi:CRISPR/Cas system CSM-associated protein Csm3 (group 7 of RAMP superfamily)
MTLKYKLKFYDYWHLSSGLSAGAKLDSTVVKDNDDLPYAPGKTIKGLAREQLELESTNIEFLHECYFSNAILDETTANEIVSNNLQDNLYDIIASTKIGENGIAVDNSLREIEVVIPVELYGEILDIATQEAFDRLKNGLSKIKRMGLNRNRGLGRCEFIVGVEK